MVDRDAVRILGRPAFHDITLAASGDLSYLGAQWRRDVAFAGYDVPIQARPGPLVPLLADPCGILEDPWPGTDRLALRAVLKRWRKGSETYVSACGCVSAAPGLQCTAGPRARGTSQRAESAAWPSAAAGCDLDTCSRRPALALSAAAARRAAAPVRPACPLLRATGRHRRGRHHRQRGGRGPGAARAAAGAAGHRPRLAPQPRLRWPAPARADLHGPAQALPGALQLTRPPASVACGAACRPAPPAPATPSCLGKRAV